MTLGELMKTWLFDYVKVHTAHNTLARYTLVYNNYVKPTELPLLVINAITPPLRTLSSDFLKK